MTGDQLKNRSLTAQALAWRPDVRRRREERQIRIDVDGASRIRIDVDGASSVNTKSLDSAGGVHVGKDDLDVCTEDSGDSKTLVKTVADHKKCDSEYQEQLSNTGGVHHRIR